MSNPQYNCLDCGTHIVQTGTPIPGTDALGYERYCESCKEAPGDACWFCDAPAVKDDKRCYICGKSQNGRWE